HIGKIISGIALAGGSGLAAQMSKEPVKKPQSSAGESFDKLLEKDANQDGQVTKAEYVGFHTKEFERKDKITMVF
ncbi:hypothetical protein P4C99_22115, partial [Pontiellaceae bacterium B1224]|nr:hypothetical protein [Pontiellaceae bacterium B1224]